MSRVAALTVLVLRRATSTPGLLAIRFLGMLLAVILVAGVSLYSTAMGDAMLQARLRTDPSNATFAVSLSGRSLTGAAYASLDGYVRDREASALSLPLRHLYVHHTTSTVPVYRGTTMLASLALTYYEGLAPHVQLVAGRLDVPAQLPGGAVPVLITRALAQSYQLRIGSRLRFGTPDTPVALFSPPMDVTGIFIPRNVTSSFWDGSAQQATANVLVTPHLRTFQLFASRGTIFDPTYFWMAQTSLTAVHLADADALLTRITGVQGAVASLAPGTSLIAPITMSIQGFLYQYNLLPFILLILVLPILALILYTIAVTAAMAVDQQAGEIVLMRSRGATRTQVFVLYLCEGVVLAGIAILIGPLLGLPLARLLGHATGFLVFSGGLPFAMHLSPQTYLYACITGLLCLAVTVVPALAMARRSMADFKREQARTSRRPFWQRFFLDLVALALALYGLSVLVHQGPVSSGSPTAAVAQNPLIAVAPLLFAVAVTLLLGRVVPKTAALGLVLGKPWSSPSSYLALQGLSRAPRQPVRLVQLCTLTLALGICSAAVAGVEASNQADQQLYQAGASVRLIEWFDRAHASPRSQNTPDIMPLSMHLALPGVRAATPALRYESTGNLTNTTDNGTIVNVLGVDPTTAGRVMWFRSDFASRPLAQLLQQLSTPGPNALVSDGFLSATGLHRGDTFAVYLTTGARVLFRVAAVAHFFPTLDPQEAPFVVTNLSYLASRSHGHGPNEVWLSTVRNPAVISRLLAIAHTWPRQILNVIGLAGATPIGDDPLASGIYGVVSIGFLIAVTLALLGLTTYAYLALQKRVPEMAILRALGLSKGQVWALLVLEDFFLLGAALVGGLIAGLLTTQLFLPYMPIATNVIPPFVVHMPWGVIGAFALALFFVLLLSLSIHVSLLLRLQLGRVLRLGEG